MLLRRGEQLAEEGLHRRRILGHALLEHIVGVAVVAEQVGDLQARVGDLPEHLRIVELAAQRARVRGAPQPLLQRTVRRVGEEGHVARGLQRHGPALLAARLRIGRQPLLHEARELGNDLRVGDVHGEGVGRSQRVLTELQRQVRELGGVFAVEFLVGRRERGAVAGEALIGLLEQHAVLRIEASRMLVDRLHAGEEARVERDVVLQLRELGLHAQGDLLHLVAGCGRKEVEEDPGDAAEQRPLTLQRHDRIAEGGLRGVLDDGLHLGARAGDRSVERRFVVLQADRGEGRGLVGPRPLGQQGIRRIEFGQLRLRNRMVGAAGCKSCKSHCYKCFFIC